MLLVNYLCVSVVIVIDIRGGGYSETPKPSKKVQVGKDQEKAQSEKDSHSKNRGGKKTN